MKILLLCITLFFIGCKNDRGALLALRSSTLREFCDETCQKKNGVENHVLGIYELHYVVKGCLRAVSCKCVTFESAPYIKTWPIVRPSKRVSTIVNKIERKLSNED